MQCCLVWHIVLIAAMELGFISGGACASSAGGMQCIKREDAVLGFGISI